MSTRDVVLWVVIGVFFGARVPPVRAQTLFSILDFPGGAESVDRSGTNDTSSALTAAITAANQRTRKGAPACVYVPAGIYHIASTPPMFALAGCIKGDGPTQSIIQLDKNFSGDLFSWSEAWVATTPGPTVIGLRINGVPTAQHQQNALVFYDRNDFVHVENVEVWDLPGLAIASGHKRFAPQAFMRESRIDSVRIFRDGRPATPAVEFTSEGSGQTDATNEISLIQVDIYGSAGIGMVVRNDGDGWIRYMTFDRLRIEGKEIGTPGKDLLVIGDPQSAGKINDLKFSEVELLNPSKGGAALRVTSKLDSVPPRRITLTGLIGGGRSFGMGLNLEAARDVDIRLSGLNTAGPNVVIGPATSGVSLDGGGQEEGWTFKISPQAINPIVFPLRCSPHPVDNGAHVSCH